MRPVPGSPTSSWTSARPTVSDHHLTASLKRVAPLVRTIADTPQPTSPSPRRSHVTGSSAGTKSSSALSDSTAMVRTTRGSAVRPLEYDVTNAEPTLRGPACLLSGRSAYARHVARAELDKQPSDVRRMFDTVAKRYDITNDLMTAGIQRSWRKSMVHAVAPTPGDLVLDLAAGTGCSSEPFAAYGATAVPCDFSVGMLCQGKQDRPGLPFVAGDGTRLPFLDDTFDAVTISYGLRNFVDPIAGLREMRRVTRPGGRLVVCEFSTPTNPVLRAAYLDGFMRALPRIAAMTASAADAYVYLAESILAWPNQHGLADLMREAGWHDPHWRNLTGGIVALHRATTE